LNAFPAARHRLRFSYSQWKERILESPWKTTPGFKIRSNMIIRSYIWPPIQWLFREMIGILLSFMYWDVRI
jgi:hypothetical protein